jgi:hypothetical protein
MNIGKLEILCDEILLIEPTKSGQDAPILKLLLDDVDASGIMRQLVSMCDPEDLLDYFSDETINEYMNKPKSELSPREQYDALSESFLNAETVEVRL